ncbi:MAG TPA: hypothetical protein VFE47_04325 [Tepidisphaeraceae bacterium]|jgi:hypothetical protein|nr:hypothetical protein [Tepidisphaeraceae bacterium]
MSAELPSATVRQRQPPARPGSSQRRPPPTVGFRQQAIPASSRAPKRTISRPKMVRTMAHVPNCPIFCDFSSKMGHVQSF